MTYQAPKSRSGSIAAGSAEYEDESSQHFSVIDRHSSFDGAFRSDRDLRIDGRVKGAIECMGTLFVAQGAIVEAKVQAENIDIAGDMIGEIHCQGLLRLLPSARLNGQVFTSQLIVNDGAIYEGDLEMKAPATAAAAGSRLHAQTTLSSQQLISEAVAASAPQNGAGVAAESPSTFVRRLGGPETPWSESETPDDGSDVVSNLGKT